MAFPRVRFPGIVVTISPLIDPKTRMMRATVELCPRHIHPESEQALRPGMFASIMIVTDRLQERLLVPREALLIRDLRSLVFTAEKGRAKWHYVEVGEENLEYVEIRAGIIEGDTVLVEGHHALAHDAEIVLKE